MHVLLEFEQIKTNRKKLGVIKQPNVSEIQYD